MSHAAITAATRATDTTEKNLTSPQVILSGIIRLLEGQRRFAEEFGLPYTRVFHQECQAFRDQKPEQIIRDWLQDKADGPDKFRHLIDDLVAHNLALCAALDGVAQEALEQLSPPAVKARGLRIFGWRPFPWFTFRRLHHSFHSNDYLRHQEMVVRGFAKAYATHRDQLRPSTRPDLAIATPQNAKEKP